MKGACGENIPKNETLETDGSTTTMIQLILLSLCINL